MRSPLQSFARFCKQAAVATAATMTLISPAMADLTLTGPMPVSSFTAAGASLGGCPIEPGAHLYGIVTANVPSAGTYTFRVSSVPSAPGMDNLLILVYQGVFSQADVSANLVGCGIGTLPEITASLTGSSYEIIVTSYQAGVWPEGSMTVSASVAPQITLADLTVPGTATGQSMTAVSDSPGGIAYSIDDPGVAIIDPATGALALLAPGTATVTATQAAVAGQWWRSGTTTATLTVTAVAPTITLPPRIHRGRKAPRGSRTHDHAAAAERADHGVGPIDGGQQQQRRRHQLFDR